MVIQIVLGQIIIMYLLMTFGYFMVKKDFLNEIGSKQISNILLKIITPVIIINSFNIEFSIQKLKEIMITLLLALIVFAVGFVISRISLGKENRLEQFAAGFSNIGFFGIPLVQGLLGKEAVFYVSIVLIAFNIYSWTYGLYLISGRSDIINPKLLFTNPASIGFGVGMIIFLAPWSLPDPIGESLSIVASTNTPLAMFVLGSYIAQSSLLNIFKDKMAYKVFAIRHVVIPLVTIFILKLIPNDLEMLKIVLLIASAAPVGISVAMFAQQYKGDYTYGARIVSLSTLLSIITMPLILSIAVVVW